MEFNELMTDSILIVKTDGRTFQIDHAIVNGRTITFDDASVPVEEGDIVEHKLPNGLVQRFRVLDHGYRAAFDDFLAGYDMKVRRL
ncbi:MAG: hypothetical protein LAO30_13105 [Acidobacteriia bacterium]|nr:hypothetical protein [Terriglobia bacterium]